MTDLVRLKTQVPEFPEVVSGHFVADMPEEEYHQHNALSASGMKLLDRSPLHFQQARTHRVERKEFDVGHAAHCLVLGVGAPVVEVPEALLASNGALSTKEAKAFVAEAREAGKVPLKPSEYTRVRFMADAVLQNAKARALLERPGVSEVSLFAQDPETGVQLRGRLDRLAVGESGALLPIDLKTTQDVRARKLASVVVDFGYDVQAWTYDYLVRLVLGVDPEPMHFIFVEKERPHEVRVVRLAEEAWVVGGESKARAAIDLFAWCQERGEWPGDDEDGGPIGDLPAPAWYARQMDALEEVYS